MSAIGNLQTASEVASLLSALGVREVCLCAGARNSPLILAFQKWDGFRKFHFFEERSAAFFALGRIKAEGRPVAVVCTSGTAVAELLPATIEAHYTGLPLILVSADRPRRYRGTGAPQAIEQSQLFGPYVSASIDWERGEPIVLPKWDKKTPAHFNICFEEPLLSGEVVALERFQNSGKERADAAFVQSGAIGAEQIEALDAFLSKVSRPLVIVGGLVQEERAPVARFLSRYRAPIFAEGSSGLRECAELQGLRIESSERLLKSGRFDGVLRIGQVPTLRYWRDLEQAPPGFPVLSMSALPFSGSTRSDLLQVPLHEFFLEYTGRVSPALADQRELFERDSRARKEIETLFERFPRSEPGMVHRFSRLVPRGSGVYLGNSLPIREWDLAATREERDFEIGANRGANGIDGQVSTFLGFCKPGRENWCLIGDLTALYDLQAPWILPQLLQGSESPIARISVMNNGGGKIFSRIFGDPVFENRHTLSLKPWAELFGLRYEFWEEIPVQGSLDSSPRSRDPLLIEIRPDAEETARYWECFDRIG